VAGGLLQAWVPGKKWRINKDPYLGSISPNPVGGCLFAFGSLRLKWKDTRPVPTRVSDGYSLYSYSVHLPPIKGPPFGSTGLSKRAICVLSAGGCRSKIFLGRAQGADQHRNRKTTSGGQAKCHHHHQLTNPEGLEKKNGTRDKDKGALECEKSPDVGRMSDVHLHYSLKAREGREE